MECWLNSAARPMSNSAKTWLAEHNYPEAVKAIERVEKIWDASGAKTRRNWWDILAGGKDGQPRIIENLKFPVLEVAQRRQHRNVTPNAIPLRDNARPPGERSAKHLWRRERSSRARIPSVVREKAPSSSARAFRSSAEVFSTQHSAEGCGELSIDQVIIWAWRAKRLDLASAYYDEEFCRRLLHGAVPKQARLLFNRPRVHGSRLRPRSYASFRGRGPR
jgi:hypothetical protein